MVINISVQYNGGFLPDIILLTQSPTTIISSICKTINISSIQVQPK